MYPISNEVKALFESEQKQILRITGGEKSPISKSVGPSAMASFSDAIAADALNLSVDITPVQSGSGDPSPTNIRPISGWTGANVTRCGKNLLNVPDRSITYSRNTYTSSNGQIAIQQASNAPTWFGLYSGNVSQYGPSTWDGSTFGGAVFVKAGQTFTLSISISSLGGTPMSGRYMFPYVYYADGTRANFSYITGTGVFTLTRTAPADVVEVSVWISNATSQVTAEFTVQLELGSTATTYEPYNGTTYDITFPTEAGTVYGGTLDVTNGTLVVDRVSMTITPSDISKINIENANSNYPGTIYFALKIPYPIKYPTTTIGTTPFDGECSVLSPFKSGDSWSDNIARIGYWYARVETPEYAAIRCKIPGIEYTLANVQQALNGCQIVYPLATPITYQLTQTQIALLEGVNNVWADCGDVTVEYATGYEYEINITDADVVIGSFSIDRFSCIGNKLEIGTATSAQMTVKLDNYDGRFNGIVFEGTELFVEIGIADWTQSNPTVNWIPCGYFTPDEQPRSLNIITIHALDRMMQFDATMPTLPPWVTQSGDVMTDSQGNIIYFVSNVQFPVTVQNLVKRVALLCGVPFTQSLSNLPNYSYTISALPTLQQEITFRNIIQWCAGIMGANAWIDWTGSLRFSWYGATTGYTSTTANRFSSDLHEDDITITGVQYTNTQNVTIVSGSADYAIDMTGNYLAATGIAEILPNVKNVINGFSYRPFTASVINAPYLWPMDMITFVKDGVNHTCAVTNVNFGINGATALESKGETAQTNSGTAPSGVTPEQGFLIEQAAEATRKIDASMNQEGIFNLLTNNGEAQGIYIIDGQVYVNMTYARSGTLALGGLNNTNGLLQVLDANGNVIGTWNKDGISVKNGIISGSTINGSNINIGGSYGNAYINVRNDDGKSVFYSYESGTQIYYYRGSYQSGGLKFLSRGDGLLAEVGGVYESTLDQYVWYTPTLFSNSLQLTLTLSNNGSSECTSSRISHKAELNPYGISLKKVVGSSPAININLDCDGLRLRSSYIFELSLNSGNMSWSGNFSVSGTKSRVVSTDQYSDRLLYCYETPSPMFGDVGEGTIGEDGKCYIWLDPVFAQTITTTQYQVFLQRYGSGECWVSERKGSYFVVEGTPGMAFGWEIKAKQRDFDQRRLERNDEPFTVPTQTYGEDAAKHIDELRKERISA